MLYLILILSIIEAALMGYDKQQSKVNGWRIPEKVLLGLGIAGGALGGLLGMRLFRHKTKRLTFGSFSESLPLVTSIYWQATGTYSLTTSESSPDASFFSNYPADSI